MRFIVSFIFLIFMVMMLVREVFYEKFDTGFEAIVIMGITVTGIYLAWTSIASTFKK